MSLFDKKRKKYYNKRKKGSVVAKKNWKNEKQVINCACGGEVSMKSVFIKNKLRCFAECEKCGRTSRYPKNLKVA